MTGICGACEHYCYIHNFEDGCCELHEKEVDTTLLSTKKELEE